MTGAKVAASIPLGKHAEVCGVVSIVSAEVSQKLGAKVLKHEKYSFNLAPSKRDSVNSLVSRALNDNKVTHGEFHIIADEPIQYVNVFLKVFRLKCDTLLSGTKKEM